MPCRDTAMLLLALIASSASAQQQSASNTDALIADAHYLRARPLVQAALQKNPGDLHALVQRSVLEWAFFHFDEAIATAGKAVALNDKSAEAHTQLTNALGAKLASSNAGAFEKMALARRFRKEADLALSLDPNSFDALEDAARFYWEAPGIVGGDHAKAQQLASHLAQLDPVRGAGVRMGFLDPKEKRAAEGLWQAAVAAQPNSPEAHAGLSAACFNDGNLACTETEARRALTLKPTHIAPWRQLAVLYATTARWDELDKLLPQARATIPDDLSPAYQAAKTILTANATSQLPRAEQYLRAYLAQPAEGEEPSLAGAHWRLALVLEKQGRRPEAIQELQTALRLDPTLEGARKDLKRLT